MQLDISVLYVEDDLNISEETVYFLKPRVKSLFVARDGVEALDFFEKNCPDMIVTDIQMPHLNGLEMIKLIRAENADIPIVITSAYSDSNYLMESLNHGVDAYLLKPIDLIELYMRLQKLAKPLFLKRELEATNDRLKTMNSSLEEKIYEETQLRTLMLSEKQEFLQSIVNGIDDPIMVIDTDYRISLMNNSARKAMEGFELIDPENPKCFEVSHHRATPCDGINHECPLHRVIETKSNIKVVHTHESNTDFKMKFFEISATPLLNMLGEIDGVIEVFRDITNHLNKQQELEVQKNQMQQHAYYDTLTGLSSRMYFFEYFIKAVKMAEQEQESMRLLFIDLDNFKEINDNYGHDIGDIVLQKFAKRLKSSVRKSDTVVRFGGDEFVIMISNLKLDECIREIIQKILNDISRDLKVNNRTFYLTCSIGVSSYPHDGHDIETLLKYADLAMYSAKKKGKNRFHIYKPIIGNN